MGEVPQFANRGGEGNTTITPLSVTAMRESAVPVPPKGEPSHANFSRSATAMASQRLLYSLSAWPLTQW